jgi:hypothetical protein
VKNLFVVANGCEWLRRVTKGYTILSWTSLTCSGMYGLRLPGGARALASIPMLSVVNDRWYSPGSLQHAQACHEITTRLGVPTTRQAFIPMLSFVNDRWLRMVAKGYQRIHDTLLPGGARALLDISNMLGHVWFEVTRRGSGSGRHSFRCLAL